MQIKRNESTLNRPQGDRVIDAPHIVLDLDNFIKQLKSEDAWDKNDRNGITLFKTDNFTTVLTCLHRAASIKDNTVDGIFQVQVLDGKIMVTTSMENAEMKQGEIIIFHPGVQHTIVALKKSTLLLQTINENGKNGIL